MLHQVLGAISVSTTSNAPKKPARQSFWNSEKGSQRAFQFPNIRKLSGPNSYLLSAFLAVLFNFFIVFFLTVFCSSCSKQFSTPPVKQESLDYVRESTMAEAILIQEHTSMQDVQICIRKFAEAGGGPVIFIFVGEQGVPAMNPLTVVVPGIFKTVYPQREAYSNSLEYRGAISVFEEDFVRSEHTMDAFWIANLGEIEYHLTKYFAWPRTSDDVDVALMLAYKILEATHKKKKVIIGFTNYENHLPRTLRIYDGWCTIPKFSDEYSFYSINPKAAVKRTDIKIQSVKSINEVNLDN